MPILFGHLDRSVVAGTELLFGGALSALVGGPVPDHLSIGWLGPIGAVVAVAAPGIASPAPITAKPACLSG